ncbi:MAG: transketolase [Armatimonadetes bacterium]|nr:transketolase [Armatimonadota bacterium]
MSDFKFGALDELSINTIRMLSADGVQKAKSGHPGLPMGAAAMAYVLWTRFLKHNPADPKWPDRDRFVLSAGHGSMLLYSLLHLTGYDLPLEELKRFRQWGSMTPGHPEYGFVPGVETTTGPLGQGFGNGIGMAVAERHLAAVFNRPGHEVVDHFTYAIVSDGDLMEGVASEAASLAGHLKLGKLIYLYDDNHISIEGSTSLAFTEDVGKRFDAYGWHTQHIDGNDLEAAAGAIRAAQAEKERPSLIVARTQIGYGSPNKQGKAEVHGEPLGEEELKATKQALGWPPEPMFYIPKEALQNFRKAVEKGKKRQAEWEAAFKGYAAEYADRAAEWESRMKGDLPGGWEAEVPVFKPEGGAVATRDASGKALNAIAAKIPALVGGSADLAPSTKTFMKDMGAVGPGDYAGRNLHFGVREHAMGSISNGMALHGGLIPYCSTFLIFSDYMKPTVRLASLMHQRVLFIYTHDSIGVGEDGPTHQPIEQLAGLRSIPNMTVIRPADANETAAAWKVALRHRSGPVAFALTRQKLPVLDRSIYPSADNLEKGAYILVDTEGKEPGIILIATGSEVSVTLKAAESLKEQGIATRVVSMPSCELFDRQPEDYRREVLPPAVTKRLAVEAASTMGWHKYVGSEGDVIGLDRFGASAPAEVVMEQLGFTPENIVAHALKLLGR